MVEWICRMWDVISRPKFLPAMVVCSAVVLITLERPKDWKFRYFLMLLVTIPVGMVLDSFYHSIRPALPEQYSLLATGIEAVYKTVPLVMGFLILRFCTRVNWVDALYGTACAYAVQHTVFCLCAVIKQFFRLDGSFWVSAMEWMILLALLVPYHYFIMRRLPVNGHFRVSKTKAFLVSGIMLLIGLILYQPIRQLRGSLSYIVCVIYDMCGCVFLMGLQVEQRREVEMAALAQVERRLRIQSQEQWELTQQSMDIINRKCHDLKHQISALRLIRNSEEWERSLREVEQSAMIYDLAVKTGNKVLDTVLSEKSLLCERAHITWTCMADGKLLDFISPVDLFVLFGNALDNAIEGSQQVAEQEMRNVSVSVHKQFGAAYIEIENYYEKPFQMKNGMPMTIKPDVQDHGYGVQSIAQIVKRYGGSFQISAKENIFSLCILIPIPS